MTTADVFARTCGADGLSKTMGHARPRLFVHLVRSFPRAELRRRLNLANGRLARIAFDCRTGRPVSSPMVDTLHTRRQGTFRCIPDEAQAAPQLATSQQSIRLNTGRVRDQWHTMTRTAKSRAAQQLTSPNPIVELHPDGRRKPSEHWRQRILSRLRTRLGPGHSGAGAGHGPDQPQGSVSSCRCTGTDQFAGGRSRQHGWLPDDTDPVSGQPALQECCRGCSSVAKARQCAGLRFCSQSAAKAMHRQRLLGRTGALLRRVAASNWQLAIQPMEQVAGQKRQRLFATLTGQTELDCPAYQDGTKGSDHRVAVYDRAAQFDAGSGSIFPRDLLLSATRMVAV